MIECVFLCIVNCKINMKFIAVCLESFYWFTARPICPLFTKHDVSDATGYNITLHPQETTKYKLLAPLVEGFDSHCWIRYDKVVSHNAFVVNRKFPKL